MLAKLASVEIQANANCWADKTRRIAIMQNYQKIPKEIKCPVCFTNNAHRLWDASSKQAAQHFVLREKHPERFLELVSHIEGLWGQNTCEVVQCDKCGFCFSNPYIAGDERFYGLTHVPSGYPTWKWEFQLTYDALNDCSTSDINLLEIGAGDGAFVRRISDNILPKENILCVEFSEYGRHHIEKFGVKCLSEDVRNLSNPELEESIDVVCMFQVLEHMDKLEVLFQKLNWLMKRGGSLFIAVPNPSRIEFNELNGALLDMPPNHIGRWNKKCFEEIGSQNGFHIEDYKVEESSFTSMARQFIYYRSLQNSQQNGSFENKILKIKNRYLLRIMEMIGKVVNSITAIPALIKMNSGLGDSLWIHLIKAKD
jgi:2-polyprenyl-3-methyl-5-hydroxy-6-metoxy-1,4-benzoquinol methylase